MGEAAGFSYGASGSRPAAPTSTLFRSPIPSTDSGTGTTGWPRTPPHPGPPRGGALRHFRSGSPRAPAEDYLSRDALISHRGHLPGWLGGAPPKPRPVPPRPPARPNGRGKHPRANRGRLSRSFGRSAERLRVPLRGERSPARPGATPAERLWEPSGSLHGMRGWPSAAAERPPERPSRHLHFSEKNGLTGSRPWATRGAP